MNVPLKIRPFDSSRSARSLLLRLFAATTLVVSATALAPTAAPATAADDPGVTVVWPEVTRFNPDHTAYTFEVDDSVPETGQLYAFWGDGYHALDVSGPQTMTFTSDGTGHIEIQRCTEDGACDVVARSPELEVWRSLGIEPYAVPRKIGPERAADFRVDLTETGGQPVELSWQLVKPGRDTVVATGAPISLVPDRIDGGGIWSGRVELPVLVPASVPNGRYFLYVTGSVDLEPFGHLSGTSSLMHAGLATVDSRVSAPRVKRFPSTLYPVRDGYRDTVRVPYTISEVGYPLTIDVLDHAGDVVKRLYSSTGRDGSVTWDGTGRSGKVVTPGRYTFEFRFQDEAGNVAPPVTRTIHVSGKKVVARTWSHTFPATSTVVGQTVGRCSSLTTPARPGWKKSLGYHSFTKCHQAARGVVATTSGVYVPKSATGHYGKLRISLTGTGASGSAGKPYLVLGYMLAADDTFGTRSEFHAGTTHPGKTVAAGPYVRDRETRPYVLWLTGLTDGSRYDVRSFTVRLGYDVLK